MTNEGKGNAGASARREHERRRAKDEAQIRKEWGRLGGIAVALSEERQSTKAWAVGARGEEVVGARLNRIAGAGARILHDRGIPGSRANIDHLVVTADGVWVVDAKRYSGRPELRVEGGVLRPRVERLLVKGRDQTKLVDGVLKQVEVVRGVVGDVPVRGVLCFVDAEWPLFGGDFRVRGVEVVWPGKLVKLLRAAGGGTVDVEGTARLLGSVLMPA